MGKTLAAVSAVFVFILGVFGCKTDGTGMLVVLVGTTPVTGDYDLGAATPTSNTIFTIRNDGDEAFLLPGSGSVSVTGDPEITIPLPPGETLLGPGASIDVTVTMTYNPLTGHKRVNTVITVQSDLAADGTASVNLTGYVAPVGATPDITVDSDLGGSHNSGGFTAPGAFYVYQFGVPVVKDMTFTIGNAGNLPLNFDPASPFSEGWSNGDDDQLVIIDPVSFEAIDPGDTRDFILRLQSNGNWTGTNPEVSLLITTDDPDESPFSLHVSGYVYSGAGSG